MKCSVMYCTLSAYFVLSVLSTDRVYTISNENLSCDNCFTINELPVDNFSQMDRLYLQVHAGRHTLNKSNSLLFEYFPQVHLIGATDLTEIVCTNNSGIMFSSVSNVVIANLSLLHCGGFGASSTHGVSAIVLHLVSDFTLENIDLRNSTAIGITVSHSYGVARIQDSVISGSPIANIVCMWGNLEDSKSSTSLINFIVENSAIEHGGRLQSYKGETTGLSGGLSILGEVEIAGNILLKNVTLYNNSGYTGGNLNIVVSKFLTCTRNLHITITDSFISHGRAHIGGGLAFSGKKSIYSNGTCHHSLELANTMIVSNQALEKGGGMGVSVDDWFSIQMRKVTLQSNVVMRPPVPSSKHFFTGGGLDFHLIGSSPYCRNTPVLVFDQCIFQSNLAHSGAGLYITADYASTSSYYSDNCTLIAISSSIFENNRAEFGAGLMLSFHAFHADTVYLISISSSSFRNNIATSQASGMLIIAAGNDRSLKINLYSLSFIANVIYTQDGNASTFDGYPSTLSLCSIAKLSLFNCTFYWNRGSAIGALYSRILVLGFLNVSHNIAAVGSGINLISSYLELKDTSFVTFKQNHASEVGGAIYAYNKKETLCFYTLIGDVDSKVFQFINNSAVISGDVLYEHTRSKCTLTNSGLHDSQFHSISTASNQSRSLIGSNPHNICLCYGNGTHDCDSSIISFSVFRGAPLALSIALADEDGLLTPGYISITDAKGLHFIHSEWNRGYTCSNIMLSTSETTAHFLLSPESYYHSSDANSLSLLLYSIPCPSGFQDSKAGTECECLPFSNTNGLLQCDASDFTFTRLQNSWIGQGENGSIRFFKSCPFNYCEPGKIILHDLSNGTVCTPERSGVLCGKCGTTLSLTLGNSNCKHCSSNFIALIILFGALGILLLVIITSLSLTITRGTINGMIFYAAFLHLNRTSFFPDYDNSNLFVIFISWLNLDFGFNVCFYDGLTSYAKVWLQFIFPMYLYIIEIIVIVTSYKSSRLARVTGARNRVKIMSTVFLLGYMKLLRTVFTVFPYAKIQSLYNSSDIKTVWLYDGNIQYYSEHHAPLFAVAVLFLVVIAAPYTISLLFVQALQRLPHVPCKVQWEGISDAHVGPFKEKFRFWLGLLLFSYTLLVLLYNFTGGDRGINLTALIIVCSLLLLLHVFLGGVYKNKIFNILESSFCFNLVILSAMYLQISHSKIGNNSVTLYTLITLAFALILAIIFYHLYKSICKSTNNAKCFNWKLPKMFATSSNYQVLSDDNIPFETEYTNASTAGDDESRLIDSEGNIELVPANWLPTNYPVPVYREHPDLLKSESEIEVCTHSDSSEKSIPELSRIRSSYLVVDRGEDEANLVEDPHNILRLQRLSVDASGDRTYVVEDNVNYIREGKNASTNTTTEHARESNVQKCTGRVVDVAKVTTNAETSFTGINSPSTYQKVTAVSESIKYKQMKRLSLSNHLRKRPPRKKISTMQCKRPQSGSNCHKCDPSFFLQSKIETFRVDRNGGQHSISSHDITLTVPPAAIKGNTLLDIEVAVMLNGPFVFPPNIRPISPVLWICSRNDTLLCKPIEITLPHFIGTLDGAQSKLLGIQFMKASHHGRTLPDGTKRFTFDHIGNNTTTSFTSHLGKLKTPHFCFLCIAAAESRDLYKHASYCLTRADPIIWNLSQQKQEIYFIVSYYMKTCLKCIKEQASSNEQIIKSQERFQFLIQNNAIPKLNVKLQSNTPGSRWTVAFEGSKQILASSVDFWKLYDQGSDLEDETLNGRYPPRFKLVVSGKNATESTIARVTFTGSLEVGDLDTDIILEPDNHDSHSLCSSIGSTGSFRTPRSTPIQGFSNDDWDRLKVEPHLPKLQNYICRVSTKWKLIGVQLEIQPHVLDYIGNSGHGLTVLSTEVLMTWQRNAKPPFIWTTFIEVLVSETIGEYALANEIALDIIRELVSY